MERARKAGIEGFWYKEASGEDILSVMDAVMAGEAVYPDIQPRVRLGMADSTDFTDRELEVLRIMTKGLSNAAIARTLCISENTVKSHIQPPVFCQASVFRKSRIPGHKIQLKKQLTPSKPDGIGGVFFILQICNFLS